MWDYLVYTGSCSPLIQDCREDWSLASSVALLFVASVGLFLTYLQAKSAANSLMIEVKPIIVVEHPVGAKFPDIISSWYAFGANRSSPNLDPEVSKWQPDEYNRIEPERFKAHNYLTSCDRSGVVVATK